MIYLPFCKFAFPFKSSISPKKKAEWIFHEGSLADHDVKQLYTVTSPALGIDGKHTLHLEMRSFELTMDISTNFSSRQRCWDESVFSFSQPKLDSFPYSG